MSSAVISGRAVVSKQEIDLLGELNAKIAELKKKSKPIETKLKKAGVGCYEGELFRAVVSVFDRDTLDMDAVREKLTPQFIAAHTTTNEMRRISTYDRSSEPVRKAA